MVDRRYHAAFRDPASEEELGLMLSGGGTIGYRRQGLNPYAAKTTEGATRDSDLTEWSLVSFQDWRGGRGQERLEQRERFFDSWNVETRIREQVTLGPLPEVPTGDNPQYIPGNVEGYGAGYPGPLQVTTEGRGNRGLQSPTKLAERFRGPACSGLYVAALAIRIREQYGTETAGIRLSLYSDSGGVPGSEVAGVDIDAGDITTTWAWVTGTFSTPQAISEASHYWLVVSTTETTGNYIVANAWGEWYADGHLAVYSGVTWSPSYGEDMSFRVTWARTCRAQSFTTPAAGLSCTRALLRLRRVGEPGSFYVQLCSDNGGEPGTPLKTAALDGSALVDTTDDWVEVSWASQALSGSTLYWLSLVAPTSEDDPNAAIVWGGDASGGYASGSSVRSFDGLTWAAETGVDLYFQVQGNILDGDIVDFERYNGKWYCAAGGTVYEWNDGGKTWDVSDSGAGTVHDLAVWNGYLWASHHQTLPLRYFNGTTWASTSPAQYAILLYAGGPEGGYLHYQRAAYPNQLYYTADGSTWEGPYTFGSKDYSITAMTWWNDMLVAATPVGLFGFAAETPYQLLDWRSQEDANNGKGMIQWTRTAALYIPLRFGLYRYNGDTMVAVGPEQDMGLPANRAGRVADLVGTCNWLFAAIDADTSGISSVLAYNGLGGWHEIWRGQGAGQRVQALGFETLHSPSRMWIGMGDETRYLKLPDYTDNPYAWTGHEFVASGELVTSWIGSELLEVVKDLHQVIVRGEDFAASRAVDVYYEVDRSDRWTYIGSVHAGPRAVLNLGSRGFTGKTVGDGSTRTTINLAAGSTTTDMQAGDWLRVRYGAGGQAVVQVASIVDSDTITLETALDTEPVAGDRFYPSRPAGREFRIKLVLRSGDRTQTPRVTGLAVRYQNNVLDRWLHVLQVAVANDMRDLAGEPYPMTAAKLRGELDAWVERVTPFIFEDPDGRPHTVKTSAAGEGNMKRAADAGVHYASVYSINLVEVE